MSELNLPESIENDPILRQLAIDVRDDYEPAMKYHNWDGHIMSGLRRIDELQESGIATDVKNWFIVRASFITHDRLLTRTKLDSSLLDGYDCPEALSHESSRDQLLSYGYSKDIVDKVGYCTLATNPNYPCETPEAKAVCRVDIGNTGDDFDTFLWNFILVQIEDKRIDQLLRNPKAVIDASCDFLSLYLRRSELSLGPDDKFPSMAEKNLSKIRSMGYSAIRATIFSRVDEAERS